ncbi:MAG: DNA-formamidopyrimidine glycosylase [Chloroflexota bacterium]
MPELPEVETIARELAPLVVGATIRDVAVFTPRTLRSTDPEAFRRAVVGRRILAVGRRAKLLTLELDDGAILAIHLKMTGQLFVHPTVRAPDRHTRVVFDLLDGRAIEFRDVRRFGRIGLARRDPATGELVGELGGERHPPHFGPEPLDPTFTAAVFERRLAARRGRLKPLLTDQRFLAGVGNIYADEALWAARLHPLRSAASVGPEAAARLHEELRRILAEAIERRGLRQLLFEPETLGALERDIHLVTTILGFKDLMPEETRQTAREVVREIVERLRRTLEPSLQQAVTGALQRNRHTPLRVSRNLDVQRTVRSGLRHYQPSLGKIVPDRLYFFASQRRYHEWRVIVLVDQSGSMAESIVYAAIFAAVFASLPSLETRLLLFDTATVDVSQHLGDAVDILFSAHLGGGTDIARAVATAAELVEQPERTLLVLITDLHEGGNQEALLQHLAALHESRVRVLCTLALNDAGTASYNHRLAREVANLGIPTFAATPQRMVAAIERAFRGESPDGASHV